MITAAAAVRKDAAKRILHIRDSAGDILQERTQDDRAIFRGFRRWTGL
jgi:hypothetical protein